MCPATYASWRASEPGAITEALEDRLLFERRHVGEKGKYLLSRDQMLPLLLLPSSNNSVTEYGLRPAAGEIAAPTGI